MAGMIYERVRERTRELESALYAALDAADRYRETVSEILAREESSPTANEMVSKRLRQFLGKSEAIIRTLEDDALTEMLFLIDRLFALEAAEEGRFI
ncbi:MAG: hypothetical protein KatS3mg011_0626 [Acidimicrobiia bacterium]|nr:MAG: hypothetical protein KatS3mg011_0626 [Acidimicrobiia bacterium]